MKSYSIYRYLIFVALTFFCTNMMSQTGGTVTADCTLKKSTSGPDVINGKYGISGSLIDATVNYEDPELAQDFEISSRKFYRVYNGETQLQDNKDNGFRPNVGLNQNLKYKVVFVVRNKKDGTETDYALESEGYTFSIYDSDYTFTLENVYKTKNTYAGRDELVSYNATIGEEGKQLPPYRIDWTINKDNKVVFQGSSYQFDPSTLQNTEKTEYNFTATVKFLNPEDNSKEWFDGSSQSSETLYVFPKKPEINADEVLIYPSNIKGNTTHNGVTCEYAVNIPAADYSKYGGIKYNWSSDINNAQPKDNIYTFTASENKKGTHTVHINVLCFNPDNPNEEWYSFVDKDFSPLTICLDPNAIKKDVIDKYISFPKAEGKDHVNTYANRQKEGYLVNIPNADEYGDWSYTWTRSVDGTSLPNVENADASFTPSQSGTYTTKLSLVCVNPNDNTEDPWLTINESEINIPNLVVYENPNLINFNDDNFTYPKGKDLAEHKGNNCSRQYSVILPENAESCGTWIYSWTRNNTVVSTTNSADIPESIGVGGYKTSLTLKCVNPDNSNDVWLNVTIPSALENRYDVYAETTCGLYNRHADPNDQDLKKYAMYLGQEFDVTTLLNFNGGCTTNGYGWKPELSGTYVENNYFKPQNTGSYTLTLATKNIAPLSSGGEKELFKSESYQIEFTVYENPYQKIDITVEDNKYDEADEVNIEDHKTINLSSTNEQTFDWVLSGLPEGNIEQKGSSSFEWTGINNTSSEDEASEYTLTCSVFENPAHFIGGFQNRVIKIFVWKEISIKIEDLTRLVEGEDEWFVMETCEGLNKRINNDGQETIEIKCVGGSYSSWVDVEWKLLEDDESGPNVERAKGYKRFTNTLTNLKSNGNEPKEYRYEVSVNYKEGSKPRVYTKKVRIITWPKPELKLTVAKLKEKKTNKEDITYEIGDYVVAGRVQEGYKAINGECYLGDEILIPCEFSGGKLDNQGGWYIVYRNQEPSEIMDNMITWSSVEKISNYFQIVYRYNGDYYTSNQEWFKSDNTYVFNFTSYSQPESTSKLTDLSEYAKWGVDRIDMYAGGRSRDQIPMVFESKNGYSNGWIYEWMVNDEIQSNDKDTWTYIPSTTTSEPYEDKTIKVHVVNQLPDGNKGLDTTYVYPVRVWHKAEFANRFVLKDENQNREMTNGTLAVREGNSITGSVQPIKYGYADNYSYIWTDAHEEKDCVEWNDVAINSKDNQTKAHETRTYKLRMVNTGPNGEEWDAADLSYNVEVYNKPATPTSIVQKGSGASRTMIATADVSDEDLQGREYYLVFGYTDDNGDHDFASQQQKVRGQVRWSTKFGNLQQMGNAYVYAVWKYDDVEITSGKCSLTGIDEAYDSSTYNGSTRAVIVEENPDALENISDAVEVRNVYTLNGVRVGSTLSGLKPGLYIVEFTNGVTNKITVN